MRRRNWTGRLLEGASCPDACPDADGCADACHDADACGVSSADACGASCPDACACADGCADACADVCGVSSVYACDACPGTLLYPVFLLSSQKSKYQHRDHPDGD